MRWLIVFVALVLGVLVLKLTLLSDSGKFVELEGLPVKVYYSDKCGCCLNYINYLRSNGLRVEPVLVSDVSVVKNDFNIPNNLRSCHTALIGGYIVEGHVPVSVIARLVAEEPGFMGVSVPGMPGVNNGLNVYFFSNDSYDLFEVV